MTPATFDIKLIDFEDAVKELERCPEMGRSLLAQKLELQGEIEAEYKRVYDLAREFAEALEIAKDYVRLARDHYGTESECRDWATVSAALARAAGLQEGR